MKKHIDRLHRWLGRLSAACENKKWESALAEADLLSAEVKMTREAIWDRAAGETAGERAALLNGGPVFMGARCILAAFAIVLFSTMPVSVEADRPAPCGAPAARKAEDAMERRLAWVTREEEDFINMLRTGLSLNNVYTAEFEDSIPKAASALAVPAAGRPAPQARSASAGKRAGDAVVRAEDILSLVRIGEKALREGSHGIKVIR